MDTPTIIEMESCVERNRNALIKFFETANGQKYIPVIESIKNNVVATQRSKGFENSLITKSAVTSLYVLIVDTEGSAEWLKSLSHELKDKMDLVAYNLAFFLYKGYYTKR